MNLIVSICIGFIVSSLKLKLSLASRLFSQISPEQAAFRLNQAGRSGNPSSKSLKSNLDLPLPGSESEPANSDGVKM
mgnify:CR=1 FL=1